MPLRIASPLPGAVEAVISTIIDGAVEVHSRLGPGLLESIYADAFCIELEHRGLRFERERKVLLEYRGRPLRKHQLDLVVESAVLVELKAVERLNRVHQAQILSYLRSSGLAVGLLMNFNCDWIRGNIRRFVFTPYVS
jgi:GxxExxY protein